MLTWHFSEIAMFNLNGCTSRNWLIELIRDWTCSRWKTLGFSGCITLWFSYQNVTGKSPSRESIKKDIQELDLSPTFVSNSGSMLSPTLAHSTLPRFTGAFQTKSPSFFSSGLLQTWASHSLGFFACEGEECIQHVSLWMSHEYLELVSWSALVEHSQATSVLYIASTISMVPWHHRLQHWHAT